MAGVEVDAEKKATEEMVIRGSVPSILFQSIGTAYRRTDPWSNLQPDGLPGETDF